jgi:hypothetical protein
MHGWLPLKRTAPLRESHGGDRRGAKRRPLQTQMSSLSALLSARVQCCGGGRASGTTEVCRKYNMAPTAFGPTNRAKCSAWAIALWKPGDCDQARHIIIV